MSERKTILCECKQGGVTVYRLLKVTADSAVCGNVKHANATMSGKDHSVIIGDR